MYCWLLLQIHPYDCVCAPDTRILKCYPEFCTRVYKSTPALIWEQTQLLSGASASHHRSDTTKHSHKHESSLTRVYHLRICPLASPSVLRSPCIIDEESSVQPRDAGSPKATDAPDQCFSLSCMISGEHWWGWTPYFNLINKTQSSAVHGPCLKFITRAFQCKKMACVT